MIQIKNLSHKYSGTERYAVENVNLTIHPGEIMVIIGSSGAGKSTLLRCINRLIEPDTGQIFVNGGNILDFKTREIEKMRQNMGMIFQQFNLIERETVLKNVLHGRLSYTNTIKSLLNRYSKTDFNIAMESLKRVDMDRMAYKRVTNLSGGEKQRVGIARALAQKPKIMLADEPVSSLDPKLMKETMDLLQMICAEDKITLIVSLHFLELAKKYATRIVGMRDGKIVFDDKPEELTEDNIVDIYGKTRDWFLYGKVGF